MTNLTRMTDRTNRSFSSSFVALVVAIGLGASMLGMGQARSATQQPSPDKAQIGQPAPDFTLTDLDGQEVTLAQFTEKGAVVVLEWFSPLCPFVKKHYRDNTMTMNKIEKEFAAQSVVWLRMNSSKPSHPAAKLDLNKQAAQKWGIEGPILLDPSGAVGKAYGAKRTPEMYIIDGSGILVYHGAIDNRSDAAEPGKVNYVRKGLTEVLSAKAISEPTTKPYGCSIKY